MKNKKKLIVVIVWPDGKESDTKFATEKGARQYHSLKSKGEPFANTSKGCYEVPKNYLKILKST